MPDTTTASSLNAALELYRDAGLYIRLFTRGRSILAPLGRIASFVPPDGSILDLGCGHGLFTNLLAIDSPRRQILGVDPSADKIAIARVSSASLANVRYLQGTLDDVDEGGFRAITILDVLYLLPDEGKLAMLRRCRELLAPGGLLLLKTNDRKPRWKYRWARLEEQIMTSLGLTEGQGLYFLNAAQNHALLELAGFEVKIVRLDSWLPYPHVLFVARPIPHTDAAA